MYGGYSGKYECCIHSAVKKLFLQCRRNIFLVYPVVCSKVYYNCVIVHLKRAKLNTYRIKNLEVGQDEVIRYTVPIASVFIFL